MKPLDLSQFKGITPGPWRIGDAGITVFGPPNGEPSPVVVACCERAKGAVRSNARAIAAVPDMLAELAALRASNAELAGALAWSLRCLEGNGFKCDSDTIRRSLAIRKEPDKTNPA